MKLFIISIIFFIIFTILYLIYKKYYVSDKLTYVKSNIDEKEYFVRVSNDKQQASNVLGTIRKNMLLLVDHLNKNIKEFPQDTQYIKDLTSRIKDVEIMETPSDDKYTSYTINKGEKMVFCIRSKIFDEIHDMNTIMYVVIHEMAHVACPEYGHTPLFKKIFQFLLKESSKIHIYNIVDYRTSPVNYCGMVINEYIL